MKKIILLFIFLMSTFFFYGIDNNYLFACSSDGNGDIVSDIENCLSWTPLVESGDLNIISWTGFKDKIDDFVAAIGSLLGLLAVGSLVYWGYLMVFSGWEEESIKKWKDVIKWWIIGFLCLIFASAIIYLVVSTFYSIA